MLVSKVFSAFYHIFQIPQPSLNRKKDQPEKKLEVKPEVRTKPDADQDPDPEPEMEPEPEKKEEDEILTPDPSEFLKLRPQVSSLPVEIDLNAGKLEQEQSSFSSVLLVLLSLRQLC